MKKTNFCWVAVNLILIAIVSTFCRGALAADEVTSEKLPPLESRTLEVRPSGWSTQASFSGLANTSLFDLTWETPSFAWTALNVRFGGGLGNYRSTDDYVSFYTLDLGLKWTLARASSTGMNPYIIFNYKSFQPSGDNRTGGAGGGLESLIGTTWNHTFRPSENTEVHGGFFLEAGTITSNFRALPSTLNARVADGFLMRVGFLRYL